MPKQPAEKELFKSVLLPFLVVITLLLATFNLVEYLSTETKNEAVLSSTSALGQESEFWEEFLSENPNYIPGWIEYAKINYQLENPEQAEFAISQIERIDPNYNINLGELN